MAPSRVIAAISVVFFCRGSSEPCRRPSFLSEPLLSGVSWRCESRSRPRTPSAWRRSGKPATATNPSLPRRAQRLSGTFFDRPSAIGQGGYRSPNGGGGDRLPKLFLESLAVLF